MNRKQFTFVVISALILPICSQPASSSTVLFSDLGTGSNVYGLGGWGISGSGGAISLGYVSTANKFTVEGVGSISVTQIDLAVNQLAGLNTFFTSILTDVNGTPGAEVSGAYWSEFTPFDGGDCCGLVSITGITGVTLIGGQSYFLVLGPLNSSDGTQVEFNFNSQGVTGDEQSSQDGGVTWEDHGAGSTLGAFNILNGTAITTPEPRMIPLLVAGFGLAGILAAYRRRSQQSR